MRYLLLAIVVVACQHAPDPVLDLTSDAAPASDTTIDTARGPVTGVVASQELCKLLSNRNAADPTANDVQHRANLLGADLGIPVALGDTTFVLFGDTIGYSGIWAPNESHPDAVGYAPSAPANAACTDLHVVTLPPSAHADPTVVADFAGAAMLAPSDHPLAEFIHNPAGGAGATFPQLPGDFEVPSGAFAYGGSIYVFYTTVVGPDDVTMTGSYLARWTEPSTSAIPAYQILYGVDERFDDNGPLHGHFINIAAAVAGDYVYLFGTGAYRHSPIYLARKRLDTLATPGGFEELGEIIHTPGYGETSVQYIAELGRWMLLAEELQPTSNRIVAYFADAPQGPWSPHVVYDMGDPAFRATYCCAAEGDCEGAQMLECNNTGFYGTYLFPRVAHDDHSFMVTYTMSSFSPYNVALFETTFAD